MSIHLRRLSPVLLVLLLPRGTAAQDTRIGDWLFTLPETMSIESVIDGRPRFAFRFTPGNMSATVLVMDSADLGGDDPKAAFAAWAKEGREALRKELAIEAEGDVGETRTATGYEQIAWVAPYTDHRSVGWVTILTCLRKERRAGALILFTNDDTRLGEAAAALDELLAGATFLSCRGADEGRPWLAVEIDPTSTPSFLWDPPPKPIEGDGGLAGIWCTTGLGAAGDPREGITTARFGYTYYTFFKNGRVLRDIPPEGLLSYRQQFWARHFYGRLGRYKLTDDAVELTFPRADGPPARETLRRRGDELIAGSSVLENVDCDTAALEGTFLRVGWQELGVAYHKGITFRPDGSFDDLGINSTVNIGWWLGGDCTLRDLTAKPGAGRWRVARNTLELLYDDGRRRRFGFHLYGDEPKERPRAIVLNGNVLVRRDE